MGNITLNINNFNSGIVVLSGAVFVFGPFIIYAVISAFSSKRHQANEGKDNFVPESIHSPSSAARIVEGIISGTISSVLAAVILLNFGPKEPEESWSDWSDWTTSAIESTSKREVETRQREIVVAYNMVHYGTQKDSSPHYRMFRDYSIEGNYEKYDARVSYGEKHLTKRVSAEKMHTATAYLPDGSLISPVYNEEAYPGFQMGNTTAYNFGDDNKVWFIESEEYSTVTEYRYRYLLNG